MSSKNILAYFHTIDNAKMAAEKIEQLGVEAIQIDQIGLYPGNHFNDIINPITGGFDSLADLTLGSFSNKNAEILLSTDVSASGMADGNDNDPEINDNVLVTIVIDEESFEKAEQIIREYKGRI